MKTEAIIATGVVGVGITAFFYRNGINHLQFGIDGYVPGPDGSIQMRIKVTNPSALFGYPVPEMFVVVYDSNDNIVGTILNKQLQWISSNGISYIYGTVQPNYQNLVSIITSLIQNGGALPTNLTFDGQIRVGRILIPFTTQAGMAGVNVYKWGKNKWTEKEFEISEKLKAKGLYLTKVWLSEYYNVYNVPMDEYPIKKNEVLSTHDLRKVEELI